MSDNNNNHKEDDARAMRRNSRRAVIFDEENLRQNKEWHDAHPVTKHIDEPKTPYHGDEGEYEDDDKEQLEQLEKEQAHIEHQTRQNTQKNSTLGKSTTTSSSPSSAVNASSTSQNENNSTSNNDENDDQQLLPKASDGWADAEYNRIGSLALRNQPIVYTSVAPSSTTTTTAATSNPDSAVGFSAVSNERNNDSLNNTMNSSVASTSSGTGPRKRPVGLKLNEVSEQQQEEAEKARHDAEFKTMRKAVYRDEGLKFREMMKAAQKAQDDEDEEVDQD